MLPLAHVVLTGYANPPSFTASNPSLSCVPLSRFTAAAQEEQEGRFTNLSKPNKADRVEKLGLPRRIPPAAHAGLISWNCTEELFKVDPKVDCL